MKQKSTISVHYGRDLLIEGSEFPACADNPGGSFGGILVSMLLCTYYSQCAMGMMTTPAFLRESINRL
jgi:hypothetical protein